MNFPRRFLRVPRTRPFGRGVGLLVSCLLISGFLYAGSIVIPRAGGAEPLVYALPEPVSFRRRSLPVFIMRKDRSVVRHGTAEFAPGDHVLVDIFDSVNTEQPEKMEALLFDSGIPVLWAAVSNASQEELSRRISLVQEEGATAVKRVATSQVFIEDYRPRLSAMLAQSLAAAWKNPGTQASFKAFLEDSDPVLRAFVANSVRQILLERLGATLWKMAQTNWTKAFGLPFGYELDYGPVLEEVFGLLKDPDIRRMLLAFGNERLASPEARRLIEHMAIITIDGLLKDPRFPALITEMAGDERLRDMLRPFGEAVASLAGNLPRLLGGLGNENNLNPLAAYVFRAFALGVESPLILYVTPDERRRIARLEGQVGIRLVRLGEGDPA